MRTTIPNWYLRFHCKASECKHTCCAGGEIDIDKESQACYRALRGEIGERVRTAMGRMRTVPIPSCPRVGAVRC